VATRRTRQLSTWGEGVLRRLGRLDRTVVELAAGLRRSTSTVYRWLATTPAPDVQRAVEAWLKAIDVRAVDWARVPQRAEEADAMATRTRVLADRALRMARRRAADQTSVIDTMRMLEKLAHETLPLVAAANLLSVVLSHTDAALGAWTPESDPTLLWLSGVPVWSALGSTKDPTGLAGRRLSALNPGLAKEIGPELDHLIETRSTAHLRTRGRWARPNGPTVWTDGVWYTLQTAYHRPYGLWSLFRVVDGAAPRSAAGLAPVLAPA